MKFCGRCGAALVTRWFAKDLRERLACSVCDYVDYRNPKILVMGLIFWRDKLLVGKRAEEPARGFWSIPAGFLESGETLQQGVAREILEETGLALDPNKLDLYSVVNMVHTDQVAIAFRMQLENEPVLRPGPECLDVTFMSEEELRVTDLAWSDTLGDSRDRLFRQLRAQRFDIHLTTVAARPGDAADVNSYAMAPSTSVVKPGT